MSSLSFLVILVAAIAATLSVDQGVAFKLVPKMKFGRSSFPPGFIFGTGSSAYQVEGAAKEGGKGPSIWDVFIEEDPDQIVDGSNASVAIDMYHRYKMDIGYMKDMGLDVFRFSISWPRILPTGKISGGINPVGVAYYNNLINGLLAKGIKPFVTIFHWDSPEGLETDYGGFLSHKIVDDYVAYADVLFQLYGDRVQSWTTFNEPYVFCRIGYSDGLSAPGRCSPSLGCKSGDSGREAYRACHHLLLAHTAAVNLYKHKYAASQKGKIGITINCNWFIPYSNKTEDLDATQRAKDSYAGWFLEPLSTGKYPATMRAAAGDRLPAFTKAQQKMIKGAYDFIGINYYTSSYAKNIRLPADSIPSFANDVHVNETSERNGIPLGPSAASIIIYPQGLTPLLLYIKEKYNNPVIYITENGVNTFVNASIPLEEDLNDDIRIDYHEGHLRYLHKAIRKGVNVKGYITWSQFDSFEWLSGYTYRFGFYFVDFNTLARYPKKSSYWYRDFLKNSTRSHLQI